MVPLEFTCNDLQRGWLEDCISIQKKQQIAPRFCSAKVPSGAKASFFKFVKLITFAPDGLGGPVRATIGYDNSLKMFIGLFSQGIERCRKKLLLIVGGNNDGDKRRAQPLLR